MKATRGLWALAIALVLLALPRPAAARDVVLWHSYRGAEEDALRAVIARFHQAHADVHVELVAVPNEGFAAKITTAVPRGHGPDLFVFGHDRIGGWARAGLLAPLDDEDLAPYLPETVPPLRYQDRLYGLPLAFKSLALYFNRALVPAAPRTTDELFALAPALIARGLIPLIYETEKIYAHAGWLTGFGGEILRDEQGASGPSSGKAGRASPATAGYGSPGAIASFDFVRRLAAAKVIPEEVSGALVASLFNQGKAAMVLSGPWFLGELDARLDVGVAPLPVVSETGLAARPFLSVEAVILSAHAKNPTDARAVARALAGDEGALTRALTGRQTVAARAAWDDPRVAADPMLAGFRAQLPQTTPLDSRPEMQAIWEPGDLALKRALRGGASGAEAGKAAMRRFASITRPEPPRAPAWPYVGLAAIAVLGGLALAVRWVVDVRRRGQAPAARRGWAWVFPAMLATTVLILMPFAVGLALALFSHRQGTWTFVGLANFRDILSSRSYAILEPLSFYYALLVSILWTVVNLTLHVGMGLGLAILLDRKGLRLKAVYRVLLVIPWAVPNYITSLIWKTLFHKQYGALNALLEAIGLERVSWFSSFGTAFFANVCANAWLGFPFMMVVALGALQAIPRDLYEAADVDGASGWAKFRLITAPLLAPAMVPAILLGIVWTFNQFNVIYLVSGGDPDNSTDILISEAFRWAFARQEQYGYAAAYAALIFLLLLGWSILSTKLARRAEAAR